MKKIFSTHTFYTEFLTHKKIPQINFSHQNISIEDSYSLVVVNMILINMMMAIINLAFEEIKQNSHEYTSKFELTDYVVRTTKEMIGLQLAKPIVPIYR